MQIERWILIAGGKRFWTRLDQCMGVTCVPRVPTILAQDHASGTLGLTAHRGCRPVVVIPCNPRPHFNPIGRYSLIRAIKLSHDGAIAMTTQICQFLITDAGASGFARRKVFDVSDVVRSTGCTLKRSEQTLEISNQRVGKMNQDSLVAYWNVQSLEMRGALLAFWRTIATCPNASSPLFASVVASIQRLKHV